MKTPLQRTLRAQAARNWWTMRRTSHPDRAYYHGQYHAYRASADLVGFERELAIHHTRALRADAVTRAQMGGLT